MSYFFQHQQGDIVVQTCVQDKIQTYSILGFKALLCDLNE